MTHKILLFMKRRPGMTMAAFEEYYERVHAPLALRHGGGMTRYLRRHLTPHPNPETGDAGELPHDVVTELWFENERIFRAAVRHIATSIMPTEIVKDEARLFDRPTMRMTTVTEHESPLPGRERGDWRRERSGLSSNGPSPSGASGWGLIASGMACGTAPSPPLKGRGKQSRSVSTLARDDVSLTRGPDRSR